MIGNSPPAIVEICFFQPCSAQVSVQRVVGLPTGRKGLGKKERETRKAGQWVDRRDSKDFHPFPFPSFNSWPSLEMLVSLAHTGKGFPLPLFFSFFLFLSLYPFLLSTNLFSLSLWLSPSVALDRGGGCIEIFRSHGSLRVKRESKEQSFSSCLDILFGKVDRVGFWTSCF